MFVKFTGCFQSISQVFGKCPEVFLKNFPGVFGLSRIFFKYLEILLKSTTLEANDHIFFTLKAES